MSPSIRHFGNKLAGGNNGIVDLYFNMETGAQSLGRVLVFGDSYARQMSQLIAFVADEVLFMRTPFLHPEVARDMKPDLVLTQNAERYLSHVQSDEQRPVFHLFPFFKEQPVQFDPQAARALSAVLSFGRAPYQAFRDSLSRS